MTDPDHHDHHPDRPRHRLELRQAGEERARADHAVARLEHRQAREEVEVDRERLAQARPRLDAEHAHEDQRQHAVAGDRGGERGGLLAPAGAELDPGEAEQPDRGRPAPERLRVVAQPAAAEQHAPDRPPRVEGAEEVAEQHAREHQPDPEDDEDEGRREVVQRRVGPVVAGHEDEREQQHAERTADHLDRPRAQHAPDPARQRPPARVLEPRARPQRGERDERHAEDRGRRPPEQPFRDRQARALHEPVGEDDDHSAVLSAFSKAEIPNDPSRRAVMRPSLPTTNSHGSVARLSCSSGFRSPCLGSLFL